MFEILKKYSVLAAIMLALQVSCTTKSSDNNSLARLKYNNQDLVVDLGVGLWAWPLPMDYDNDGDLDLLVSCRDKPFHGVWFFENRGGNSTVFKAPVKISHAERNLQISYINDSSRILTPYIEYENFNNRFYNSPVTIYKNKEFDLEFTKMRADQWKYVDYENDGDLDIIVGRGEWGEYGWDNAYDENGNWTNGPLHGYVYLIENKGDSNYLKPVRIKAGENDIDVYGMPSPNFADFDNDGDLDIICGEFVDRFTWFENTGTRELPKYVEGRFLENSTGVLKMDLQMIVPVGIDWDRDGFTDLVVGDEDGRIALVKNSGKVKDRMPVFKSPGYFKQEADNVKFGALVTPFSIDWDYDGDEDLICGNTAGHIGFIENLDGGNPPRWNKPVLLEADGEVIRIMAGENGSIQGPCERKWGYTTLSVADWDGDSIWDIVVNSIFGKVIWFKGAKSGDKLSLQKMGPVKVEWQGNQAPKPAWNWWNPEEGELVTQWRTTPFAIDWNKDGLTDLISLDHEGYLSFFERFLSNGELLLNPGKRIFFNENGEELRLNEKEAGKSGRRKFTFIDRDNDGDLDLFVNSKNVDYLENISEPGGKVIFKNHGLVYPDLLAGHSTSPTTVDWDGDGKRELLIGAEDGHFYLEKKN
ncbi:MAG: VCBS repeat-containing protein [Bacteroidota bacterium]